MEDGGEEGVVAAEDDVVVDVVVDDQQQQQQVDEEYEDEQGPEDDDDVIIMNDDDEGANNNNNNNTANNNKEGGSVEEAETASTNAKQQQQQQPKCWKCGKMARKGCTQNVCVKCCTDLENCQVHIEQRVMTKFKEQIKNGTTLIQRQAKEERSKCLTNHRKNFFKEKGFQYMGDTVIIWNIHEFMSNSKWKEDSLRKSHRRNARREEHNNRHFVLRNSKRRFRHIIKKIYADK